MWVAIAPDFFSLSENPWYYIMGAICLFLSIRGLVIYKKIAAGINSKNASKVKLGRVSFFDKLSKNSRLIAVSFCWLFFGDMDLFYYEILPREDGFFKATAIRAVALMLDNIKYLVTVVALRHAGNDIHDELCSLEYRTLGSHGINILDILRDDEGELADVENYLVNFTDIVLGGKFLNGAHDLLYNAYLMHITS